jgi:hypothetical protein
MVISHPKMTAGKKIIPESIIFKSSWFSHQPINHMSILNMVFAFSSEAGNGFNQSLRVAYLDLLSIYVCPYPFANQAAVYRIRIMPNMDRTATAYFDFLSGTVIQPCGWQVALRTSLSSSNRFLRPLLTWVNPIFTTCIN